MFSILFFIIQIQHLLKLNLFINSLRQRTFGNSNTTLVKVKYKSPAKTTGYRSIQIQHLLKLNFQVGVVAPPWYYIQIQHLLKLNFALVCSNPNTTNSNTTLVKVKYSHKSYFWFSPFYSNTTLVKVKFYLLLFFNQTI